MNLPHNNLPLPELQQVPLSKILSHPLCNEMLRRMGLPIRRKSGHPYASRVSPVPPNPKKEWNNFTASNVKSALRGARRVLSPAELDILLTD